MLGPLAGDVRAKNAAKSTRLAERLAVFLSLPKIAAMQRAIRACAGALAPRRWIPMARVGTWMAAGFRL